MDGIISGSSARRCAVFDCELFPRQVFSDNGEMKTEHKLIHDFMMSLWQLIRNLDWSPVQENRKTNGDIKKTLR